MVSGRILSVIAVLAAFCIAPAARGETLINLERYGGKLRQVSVHIAGGEHKFLFDTGGGHTLVSPAVAAALGCRPSGRILGFRMNGEKFETPKCVNVSLMIGRYVSAGETVGVFDLMTLLPKDFPPLDGVISLASFRDHAVTLDLGANKLTVDPLSRAVPGQPFPCRIATGVDGADTTLFAGVMRAGTEFWLEVDSGNLDMVRLAPHAAPFFGVDANTPRPLELALGDGRSVKTEARVVELVHDGALSASFLEQGILFADLRQRTRCSWLAH